MAADPYWNAHNRIYGDNGGFAPDINAIKQSSNLYLYVNSNPVNYVDPLGLVFSWQSQNAQANQPFITHSEYERLIRGTYDLLTGAHLLLAAQREMNGLDYLMSNKPRNNVEALVRDAYLNENMTSRMSIFNDANDIRRKMKSFYEFSILSLDIEALGKQSKFDFSPETMEYFHRLVVCPNAYGINGSDIEDILMLIQLLEAELDELIKDAFRQEIIETSLEMLAWEIAMFGLGHGIGALRNTAGGLATRNNAGINSFASMMSPDDAARYNKYWSLNAPDYTTPGAKFDHFKLNGNTIERSTVIYDKFGRQVYRIDHNNHGFSDHSKPHLHERVYAPGGRGPDNFTNNRYNFWRPE